MSAAQDHRGRGVPLDPEDRHGPAARACARSPRPSSPACRRPASATDRTRTAARAPFGHDTDTIAARRCRGPRAPGLVFPLSPARGKPARVRGASVASGGIRAFSPQVRRAGRGRCTRPVRLWHQGRRHRLRRRQQRRAEVRPEDRHVRRADRPERQPRHQHPERRQARPQPVQRRRTPTARSPSRTSTRRATRPRRPAWPRRPSTTRRSSASSARPSPVSPRPPTRCSTRPASSTITPSATNPTLADNGWKTFFRALGNDATQGPAAAKYIKDTLKADEGVRHRRRVRVRQGPGRHRPQGPRLPRSSATTRSSRSRPTSAPPSPRSRRPAPTRSSSVATTPEAAPLDQAAA